MILNMYMGTENFNKLTHGYNSEAIIDKENNLIDSLTNNSFYVISHSNSNKNTDFSTYIISFIYNGYNTWFST